MHIHRKFWSHFFSRSYALFELRKLTKMHETTATVGQHHSTETAQQNCMKFVVMKDIMCRCAFLQEMLVDPFEEQFISPFLSDCPSLMLGIAFHSIQHSQAMLERGVCELAHSFFHYIFNQNTQIYPFNHCVMSKVLFSPWKNYQYYITAFKIWNKNVLTKGNVMSICHWICNLFQELQSLV